MIDLTESLVVDHLLMEWNSRRDTLNSRLAEGALAPINSFLACLAGDDELAEH